MENRIGYFGEQRDKESDYFAMGFRLYDPEIGRFLAIDPLLDIQPSQTPYHYCFNNPTSFTDPTGLYPEKEKGDKVQMWVLDDWDLQNSFRMMLDNKAAYYDAILDFHRWSANMFSEYSYRGYVKNQLFLAMNFPNSIGRVGSSSAASNGITKFLSLLTQHKRQVDACVSFTNDLKRECGIAFIEDKDGNIRLYYELAPKERKSSLTWHYTLNEGETVIARLHVHYERDGINGVDAFSVYDETKGSGDLISAISGYDQSKGKGFIEAMISNESNMLYILEVATAEQRNAINDGIFHSLDLRPWNNWGISGYWNGDNTANHVNDLLRTGKYGNFYMKPYIIDPNLKKPDKFIFIKRGCYEKDNNLWYYYNYLIYIRLYGI